ncbi:lactonase family protein [Sinorhizobium meliloti]|uniref:lactonase family protein n=1 Tax=Rhizobium meliloti TaxID=382 RepID=UPI0013E2D766|nr:beta-propeller fold lactonase family protein [Sinorhizobium meliloti]
MRSNFAYVGCRTTRERNARGKGISVFRIDETGQWQLVAVEETRPNPSFLTVEGTGRFLYAAHGDGTEMSSFHIGEDGRVQAMGHSTSAGMNPVDVALDPTGRHLIVTNHLLGSLTVHYLLGDGRFGPLTDYAQITGRLGPHKIDQLSPKPHQAVFHAGGKRLFVPNKGTDRGFSVRL